MAEINVMVPIETLLDHMAEQDILTDTVVSGFKKKLGGKVLECAAPFPSDQLVEHAPTQTLADALDDRDDYYPPEPDFDLDALIDLSAAIRRGDRVDAERALDLLVADYPVARETVGRARYIRAAA